MKNHGTASCRSSGSGRRLRGDYPAKRIPQQESASPAAYLAQHHQGYSAGDIAFGMIFHNLGRNRLGLASLYYVVDVELAAEALCNDRRMKKAVLCGL